MVNEAGEISEKEKVRIAGEFITHAPPGEFNEVFNDVRLLINNDQLLKEGCSAAFLQYHKEQFTPVRLEGQEKQALITAFNDLGNGRFYDPRHRVQFSYDSLRKEASDARPWEGDNKAESWRSALQSAVDAYVDNQFKTGTSSVFGKSDSSGHVALQVCIEAHQFQPRNYWNGRWRSQWSTTLSDKSVDLTGSIKVQVHYYEDGNVQLVSTKEISRKINVTDDARTAKEIIRIIEEEESAYQHAVADNYQTMSETTFKALRRMLPVTRSKLDWGKILTYKVVSELKPNV